MSYLYHITSEVAADKISANGHYYSETFSQEGFIHCSFRDQLLGVAARYYVGEKNLVVLEINPAKLDCEIREENLTGAEELFPHLYGPIPEVAITAIYDFSSSTGELSERPNKGPKKA